jgi:hypothetical protein
MGDANSGGKPLTGRKNTGKKEICSIIEDRWRSGCSKRLNGRGLGMYDITIIGAGTP